MTAETHPLVGRRGVTRTGRGTEQADILLDAAPTIHRLPGLRRNVFPRASRQEQDRPRQRRTLPAHYPLHLCPSVGSVSVLRTGRVDRSWQPASAGHAGKPPAFRVVLHALDVVFTPALAGDRASQRVHDKNQAVRIAPRAILASHGIGDIGVDEAGSISGHEVLPEPSTTRWSPGPSPNAPLSSVMRAPPVPRAGAQVLYWAESPAQTTTTNAFGERIIRLRGMLMQAGSVRWCPGAAAPKGTDQLRWTGAARAAAAGRTPRPSRGGAIVGRTGRGSHTRL